MLQGWTTTMPRVLAIRGEPVVIYGIAAGPAGPAAPWLAIVSTIAREDLLNVMWLSRAQVDCWLRRWAVRQWLDWLGFVRQGRAEAFGAAGLPFELYQRAR